MEKIEFSELATSVSKEFEDKSSKITEFRVATSIISLEKFYETFNSQALEKATRIPAIEHESSIEDFAAIFKSFESYPENIKPKKAITKELSRMNSTLLNNCTSSSLSENVALHKDHPSCSDQIRTRNFSELEDQESAKTILKKYEQFKLNLVKLSERAQRRVTFAAEYATKLQQINVFAQQLEKLLPSYSMKKQAFSCEDQLKLETIAADMKRLSYLQKNQDVFDNVNNNNEISPRLEGLVDVLAHALISISCYNEI